MSHRRQLLRSVQPVGSVAELRKFPVQTINLLLQQYHLPHDGRKHDKIDRLATAMFPPTSASVASSQASQALGTPGRHPATRPHQPTQDLVDVDVLRSIVTDAISPLQRSLEDLESRVQSLSHGSHAGDRTGSGSHSRKRPATDQSPGHSKRRKGAPEPSLNSASDDEDDLDDASIRETRTTSPRRSPRRHPAQQSSVSLGSLTGAISQPPKRKIVTGEFVDLEELYAELLPWALDGQSASTRKVVRSKSPRLPITEFSSWSIAFTAYASELLSAHPSRGSELFQYMVLIAGANKDFKPSAWLKYDLNFRRRAAAVPSLRWDCADPHLWSLSFTGPDVCLTQTVTCFRCGAAGHVSTKCNFRRPSGTQGTSSSTTDSGSSARKSKPPRYVNPDEPCFRYNKDICNKPAESCPCKHCCSNSGCGGPHPVTTCPHQRAN